MENPKYRIVDINTIRQRKKLNDYIFISSYEHSYSLCIQYMEKWFMSKFPEGFFADDPYIDNSHVFHESRELSKNILLSRGNPRCAIYPTIDDSFNRDNLDLHQFGLTNHFRFSRYEESFFKDAIHNSYLSLNMDMICMNFVFKAKFKTLSQQLDAFKYMKMAFRVGSTQGAYVSMDYIIPMDLMLSLAKDNGFEIKDKKIAKPLDFLYYLNSHSQLPILYKYRTVNGVNEFFLRIDEIYVHINSTDISRDDGERVGNLKENFMIEMNCTVRFPTTQYYVYHTDTTELQIIRKEEVNNFVPIFSIQHFDIPKTNSKGWDKYIMDEYEDEKGKPISIDFNSYFDGGDLGQIIQDHIKSMISPELFIDIQVYNATKNVHAVMNWETMIMSSNDIAIDPVSDIAIYLDLAYINNYKIKPASLEQNKNNVLG